MNLETINSEEMYTKQFYIKGDIDIYILQETNYLTGKSILGENSRLNYYIVKCHGRITKMDSNKECVHSGIQ